MGARDEAVVAGDAVALDDLRQLPQQLGDCRDLARRRADADTGRQGIAERRRIDLDREALDDAGLRQPLQPFGHARRRHAEGARKIGERQAAVALEPAQQLGIDVVNILVFVSKAFHGEVLYFKGKSVIIYSFIHIICAFCLSLYRACQMRRPLCPALSGPCRPSCGSWSARSSTISAPPSPCCCSRGSRCWASPGSASPARRPSSRSAPVPGAPSPPPRAVRWFCCCCSAAAWRR